MPLHPPARRQRATATTPTRCSARTRKPASTSRSRPAGSAPTCSSAKAQDKEEKPKRAGIPKGWSLDDITLETALKLLSLPREVGKHPEDGEPILAGIGRFGPYVQHGKTYANLDSSEDVLTIGLNRAVTLIAEKLANPGKGRRFGADPGRSLGDHPQRGGPILVKKGRYGPYVTNSGINATIPDDKNPEEITLDEAVELIEARAEKTGGQARAAAQGSAQGPRASAAADQKPKPAKPKKKRRQSRAKPLRLRRMRHGAAAMAMPVPGLTYRYLEKAPHQAPDLPSREDVLAFIGTHKGKAGVREIARAFGAEERRSRRAASRCCASLPTKARSSGGARSCTMPAPCPPSCSPTSPIATRTAS